MPQTWESTKVRVYLDLFIFKTSMCIPLTRAHQNKGNFQTVVYEKPFQVSPGFLRSHRHPCCKCNLYPYLLCKQQTSSGPGSLISCMETNFPGYRSHSYHLWFNPSFIIFYPPTYCHFSIIICSGSY